MSEEEQLLRLDREWNEAYPRLDVTALDRIIADDWVCIECESKKPELEATLSSNCRFVIIRPTPVISAPLNRSF